MQPLKHTEQALGMAHVESDTDVLHEINLLCALHARADLDAGWRQSRGEFDCVGNKDGKDLLEECAVGRAVGESSDAELDTAPFELLLEIADDPAHQRLCLHPASL